MLNCYLNNKVCNERFDAIKWYQAPNVSGEHTVIVRAWPGSDSGRVRSVGRARGRDAGDADAGRVQHGGRAGARHAHVRGLHALRRVPLQRGADARRGALLR